MKRIIVLIFFTLFLASCGGTKNNQYRGKEVIRRANIPSQPKHRANLGRNDNRVASRNKNNRRKATTTTSASKTSNSTSSKSSSSTLETKQNIIDYAKTFQGTRYKFGGTTSAGMDCSGLICTAFEKENISLPRVSRDMAKEGKSISLREIEKGDLVFFKTTKKNVISHVGLVVDTSQGKVRFIHSSTSAGVIISSLDEAYWKRAFVEVRRVI